MQKVLASIVRTVAASLAAIALLLQPVSAQASPRGAPATSFGAAARFVPPSATSRLLARDLDALLDRIAPRPAFRPSSSLWAKIRDLLLKVIGPDVIDMAEFTFDYPQEAASVLAHAVDLDFPFFGLVAAAKAAKHETLPGIGYFDYAKCVFPVTAIDGVFAKADSLIDQGKGETKGVVGQAKSFGAQAAKMQTAAAKDQLNEQLMSSVPYFGEIETICRFAFETDFKADQDMKLAGAAIVRDIRKAYEQFSNGDVAAGVGTLITLGLDARVACAFIDSAVAGGLIGRTPLLGDLLVGACEGFVGAVLDGVRGVVYGGLGYAAKGVTAVYDLGQALACKALSYFGGGCSDTPPPPTAGSVAASWCAGRGGIESLISKTNAPNDYALRCNDTSTCRVQPGLPPRCHTREEADARRQALAQIHGKALAAGIPKWRAEFYARWTGECPKENISCGIGISALADKVMGAMKLDGSQHPGPLSEILLRHTVGAESAALKIVNDSRFESLPKRWTGAFDIVWGNLCRDPECKAAVKAIAAATLPKVQAAHAAKPWLLYSDVTSPLYLAADGQARAAVDASEARYTARQRTLTKDASLEWEAALIEKYSPQCVDGQCTTEVRTLAGKARVAMRLYQMGKPDASAGSVQLEVLKEYRPQFEKAVADSQARAQTRTKDASAEWEQILIGQWTPKCADQICVGEVKTLAGKAKVAMRLYQLGKPGMSAGAVQLEVLKEYRPQFEQAVAASNRRRVGRQVIAPTPGPAATPTPVPAPRGSRPWRPVPRPSPTPR